HDRRPERERDESGGLRALVRARARGASRNSRVRTPLRQRRASAAGGDHPADRRPRLRRSPEPGARSQGDPRVPVMPDELSARERVLLFLYSTRHIAGSVAALLGLGLYFLGVVDRFWWAIVAALYVGGYLVVPRDEAAERVARADFNE